MASPFDEPGDVRPTQITFTASAIQVRLQFKTSLPIVFNPQQCLPFAAHFARESVVEAERNKLHESRLVAMRQITILVPTEESSFDGVVPERLRPLTLTLNQLSCTGIVGRTSEALGIR